MSKRKGRPAGSTSRYCLIKDTAILPYEIHVDESTHTYLKVVSESQSTVGYYASLAHLMKSILKEKHVPQGSNGKVYNLKEYIIAMQEMEKNLMKVLHP
jgi:hypothetical protein